MITSAAQYRLNFSLTNNLSQFKKELCRKHFQI